MGTLNINVSNVIRMHLDYFLSLRLFIWQP